MIRYHQSNILDVFTINFRILQFCSVLLCYMMYIIMLENKKKADLLKKVQSNNFLLDDTHIF